MGQCKQQNDCFLWNLQTPNRCHSVGFFSCRFGWSHYRLIPAKSQWEPLRHTAPLPGGWSPIKNIKANHPRMDKTSSDSKGSNWALCLIHQPKGNLFRSFFGSISPKNRASNLYTFHEVRTTYDIFSGSIIIVIVHECSWYFPIMWVKQCQKAPMTGNGLHHLQKWWFGGWFMKMFYLPFKSHETAKQIYWTLPTFPIIPGLTRPCRTWRAVSQMPSAKGSGAKRVSCAAAENRWFFWGFLGGETPKRISWRHGQNHGNLGVKVVAQVIV